jgi:hypothetical protein
MLSLFEDASGNWHWQSVLTATGWVLAGLVLFLGLWIGKIERDKAGPWKVSEAQRASFLNYLKATPAGKVAIEYTAADQVRSHAFATIVGKMIAGGGYNVWGYMPAFQQTGNAAPLVGVKIGIKPQSRSTGEHIQKAFMSAGIEASIGPEASNNYEDDRAVVYIGIKPKS